MDLRVEPALQAIRRWGDRDPTGWGTGLSPEGARAALSAAVESILGGSVPRPVGIPPKKLVIWCSGSVFTAPAEWVTLFSALGSEVLLKAPSRCPEPSLALAGDFAHLGVSAVALPHEQAWHLLEGADAVLGFGPDAAMRALHARLPPGVRRSLHGHRASFAVVSGDPALAPGLALDAALYDGRGCMSPAAVFCLGDPLPLAAALAREMERLEREIPCGALDPASGPERRRRCGLARIYGRSLEGEGWAVPILPPEHAEAAATPRMLPVHPVPSLRSLAPLSALPLSSCATDLSDPEPLIAVGFDRICAPGQLQKPPMGRPHDGVDVVAALSRQISRG